MRGGCGRILEPWGSSWARGTRTGAHGEESSSSGQVLETWAAWCGGGSRMASNSPEAEPGTGERTCSRVVVSLASSREDGGVEVEATRGGEELRPVPAHR